MTAQPDRRLTSGQWRRELSNATLLQLQFCCVQICAQEIIPIQLPGGRDSDRSPLIAIPLACLG
jgi:hypothetical protein